LIRLPLHILIISAYIDIVDKLYSKLEVFIWSAVITKSTNEICLYSIPLRLPEKINTNSCKSLFSWKIFPISPRAYWNVSDAQAGFTTTQQLFSSSPDPEK